MTYGPDHPWHIGYRIMIELPKGTSEEDALIARDVVREHFPEAVLQDYHATGWDISSGAAASTVEEKAS